MNVLQGMDMNQFIIIAPTALIVMYVVITLEKRLSESKNAYFGLIIPGICFIVATILAFRPLFVVDGTESDGLMGFCLRMWMTFNIPTLALLFPYFIGLKNRKVKQAYEEAMAAEENISLNDGQDELKSEA